MHVDNTDPLLTAVDCLFVMVLLVLCRVELLQLLHVKELKVLRQGSLAALSLGVT